MDANRQLQRAGLIVVAIFAIAFAAGAARGQEVVKANNTDALNLGSSWVGGAAPTISNVAVWESTLTSANSVALGGDLSLGGLKVTNPGGSITIGGGHTLTLGSSGINMSAATQDLTLDAAVTIGAAQAWNVTTGRLLDMNGSLSGSALLTKSGSGTLNLDGDNSGFSGGVSLSTGRLNIGHAKAIGSGTLSLSNATTLGNISGGAIEITNRVAMGLANWTYAGTERLTFGGAVSMAGNREITVSSGELVIGGGFDSGLQLRKLGAGALTLSASNANSNFRFDAGTLNINHARALGAGAFAIHGGVIDNTSGGAITNANNNAMGWNGNFSFAGTNDLNLGSGAVTLNSNRTVTVSAGNLTVGGAIGGAFALTKAGNGALTLSGSNSFTSGTLSAGVLNINHSHALSTGLFTIGGVSTIDNTSGAAITNASNNAMAWNANFTFAGTNDLNLGTGVVTLSANRMVTIASGNLSVGGPIGGAFTLSKAGGGTLTLGTANTYTGATFVNEGTLATSASNALASSARVTVAAGAMLRMGASDTLAVISGSGSVVLGEGTLSVGGNTSAKLAVGLSGTAGFAKIGSSFLIPVRANTYTGSTRIQAGTLVMQAVDALGNGGDVVFTGGTLRLEPRLAIDVSSRIRASSDAIAISTMADTVTFASPLASSNVGGLNKIGLGALKLTAANAYSGTTTVSGGRLVVDGGAGGSIQASSALAFGATGTFDYDNTNASSARAQSLGALTSAAGAANVQVTRTAAHDVSLTFASLGSRAASATRNFVYGGSLGTIGVDSKIAISGQSAGMIDAGTFFQGSNYAAYDAGGFVRGVEYGVDANSATSGAAASVSSVAYQRVTGNLSAQQSATFTGLNIDGAANVAIGASQTITTAGILKSGGGSSSVSGGTGIQAPANEPLVAYAASGNTLTISADILANGSNALVKSGGGTLVLSSTANAFTGGTVLNEGMLRISSADQLPLEGSIAFAGGALQWGGANATITATLTPRFTAAPGQNFQIDVLNSTATLTLGSLSGSGFVKSGSGQVTLASLNTFETVVIDGGTLRGGNHTNTFGPNARLYFVSGRLTGGPNALGNGDWSHNDVYVLGDFTFINNNSGNNGGTYYQLGSMDIGTRTMTFDLGGSGTTASGTVRVQGGTTLSGNATFNLNRAVGNEVAFVGTRELGGSFGFTKSGVGAIVLEGEGFHTGVTTIADGSVRIAHADALKRSTANVLVDNGLVFGPAITAASFGQLQGGGNVTLENLDGSPAAVALSVGGNNQSTSYSGVLSGAGSVTKDGTGALTLSGVNTFSGGVAIADGSLSISSINDAGSNGVLGSGVSAVALGSSGKRGTLSYTGATGSSSRAFSAAAGGTAAFEVTDSASTLTLSGLINGDGDKTFGGAGNFLLGGGFDGVGGVFKTGAGAMTLAGPGHAGSFSITEGRLNINAANALGDSSGSLSLGNGVSLDNTSGSLVTIGNSKPISLGSSLNFVGSNSLGMGNGTVTLSGNTAIDVAANSLTFGGDVVGAGYGITKTGTGTLVLGGLSGASSFTGNTHIQGGRIQLSGLSVLGGGSSTVVTVDDGAYLEVGPTASVGNATINTWTGGLITGTTISASVTYTTSGTLTSSDSHVNGVQTIGAGVVVSASADLFGTDPGTPTAGRIVMQDNARMRATTGFTMSVNKGIQLNSGTATFESASGQFVLPNSISGAGALIKTGTGGFRVTGSNSYEGGTIVQQGTFGIASDASLGAVTGRLLLDGGTVNSAQDSTTVTINSSRQIVLANGKTSGIDANPGGTIIYAGAIGEDDPLGAQVGSLRIGTAGRRDGTVILGGANLYRGTTTVAAGTLVVNGSLGQGNLTVDSGATLKGSGVINGFTSIQGTHSPGNSPGLETFTNGLTYGSSSTLVWELSANTALSADRGTLYDGINLTNGSLTIDPGAKIDLVFNAALAGGGPSTVDWDDPFWASSQAWKVIDVQSGLWTPGIFTLNSIGTDASGQSLSSSVRSNATFSLRQDNAGSVYVEYVIVPEPDTVIFAGIGIAMAGWSLWKRRRAS